MNQQPQTNLLSQNQGQGGLFSTLTSQQPQMGNFGGTLTTPSSGGLFGNLTGGLPSGGQSLLTNTQGAFMQQPQIGQIQNPQMQYFNQVNGGLYDELLARQQQPYMSATGHIQGVLQPMPSQISSTAEAEVIFILKLKNK